MINPSPAEALKAWADAIDTVAFKIPAPNPYTPELAMIANAIRETCPAIVDLDWQELNLSILPEKGTTGEILKVLERLTRPYISRRTRLEAEAEARAILAKYRKEDCGQRSEK